MTNILLTLQAVLSITIETNVVSGSNESGCRFNQPPITWPGGIITGPNYYHPFHEGCTPHVAPTEKWETTSVVEVKRLTFDWLGMKRTVEERFVLSSTTKRWKMESEWKEDTGSISNAVGFGVEYVSPTNFIVRTNVFRYWTNAVFENLIVLPQ